MKEKILAKTEVTLTQEIICQNINNLAGSIATLSEIDSALLGKELGDKLESAKDNIINSIYYMSTYLQDKE